MEKPPDENASPPPESEGDEFMDAMEELKADQEGPSNGPSEGETLMDEKKCDADAPNLLGLPKEEKTLQEANMLNFSQDANETVTPSQEANLLDFSSEPSKEQESQPDMLGFGNVAVVSGENETEQKATPVSLLDQTEEKEEASSSQQQETNLLDLPVAPAAATPAEGSETEDKASQQQETKPLGLFSAAETESLSAREGIDEKTSEPQETNLRDFSNGAKAEAPTEGGSTETQPVHHEIEQKIMPEQTVAQVNEEAVPEREANAPVAEKALVTEEVHQVSLPEQTAAQVNKDTAPETGSGAMPLEEIPVFKEAQQAALPKLAVSQLNEENGSEEVPESGKSEKIPVAAESQATLPEQAASQVNEETAQEGGSESSPPEETAASEEEMHSPPSEESKKSHHKVESIAKGLGECESDVLMVELQSSLQEQMQLREEAEERAREAEERVRQYEKRLMEMSDLEEEVEKLHVTVEELNSDKSNMEYEMNLLEQSRDEHERKAIVLSNRLNAAKKKEGIKANLVEELEGENKELQSQLSTAQKELIMVTAEKESLELEMDALKKKCVDRVKSAENALEEEHRLNEERKKKMKLYIEAKAEELRVAKAHNDELQVEVEQTQISLRETNDRWKQLHAQWVQSQTRNRELQRDLNRIKKDSDHLHKVGDSLEMKLSRSAQETEEHKNKRLTAKHELMTILRTLEAERSVSGKLRDSIKFTFTPKALSQQQLLNESLQDFEAQLMKLSRRLGKPLPPQTSNSTHFHDDGGSAISTPNASDARPDSCDGEVDTDNDGDLANGGSKRNRSEIDSNHLLSNLENETQRVSQCIMALISNIERMHVMLDEGERTCVSALTDLLTGVHNSAVTAQDETSAMTGGSTSRHRLGTSRYGPVPSS